MRFAWSLLIGLLMSMPLHAQFVGSFLPKEIHANAKYMFYLHGGVVTVLGNNAINQSRPEWGPYQYLSILDSLASRGVNVISEIRKEGVDDAVYVEKIVKQIDSLLENGVGAKQIMVVGASAGMNIAIYVSSGMKNKHLRFVVMGGCWPDTYKEYIDLELYGSFLSIIEKSDPHGTCASLFEGRDTLSDYEEIVLSTGLSHGFIYKGYKEWIDPVIDWYSDNKKN